MVSTGDLTVVEASHEPAPNRPRPSSSFSCSIRPFQGRGRRTSTRTNIPFMAPTRDLTVVEAFHEPDPCGLRREAKRHAAFGNGDGLSKRCRRWALPPQSKRFTAPTRVSGNVEALHEPRIVLVLRPRCGRPPSPRPSPPGRGCPVGRVRGFVRFKVTTRVQQLEVFPSHEPWPTCSILCEPLRALCLCVQPDSTQRHGGPRGSQRRPEDGFVLPVHGPNSPPGAGGVPHP